MIVAVDQGHGGRDPGAVADGVKEATITAKVGRLVAEQLKETGHRPVLTRGEFVTLQGRARTANQRKCDRFVSIHCNAALTEQPRGIETWFFPGSVKGERLAAHIQAALMMEFPDSPDRGIKDADFAVLRLTKMPAVLVELEFLTHPEARQMLTDPEVQRRYAVAIARAVVEARL